MSTTIASDAASVVNNLINTVAAGAGKVYEDGKNIVTELPSKVGNVVATVEALPLNVVDKVEQYQKTAAALVGIQDKVASTVGDLATIATNVIAKDSDKLQQGLNEGAKNVVGSASKAALNGLYGIPGVGQLTAAAVGTASTGAAALDSANNIVSVGTGIMNNFAKEASGLVEQSNTGQTGGAKTRRHLKKMIRERQLIQTRTKKMIHEFMNPSHSKTQNKKHIIKKTKRRRRR